MAERLTRRSFLFTGAAVALVASPAIVRVSSLMPVKAFNPLAGLSGDFGVMVDWRLGTTLDFRRLAIKDDLYIGLARAMVRADANSLAERRIDFVCSPAVNAEIDRQGRACRNVFLAMPDSAHAYETSFRGAPIKEMVL